MCINSFMNENDVIQGLLAELVERICANHSAVTLQYSPIYSSSQSIERKFHHSIDLLNNSLKQFLKYELNTVVHNGQLTSTPNIRHSRYYNPATTIKQSNDLKKKLHWIQQRQTLIQQLNLNQQQKIHQINCDVQAMDQIWFEQRFELLDHSLALLKTGENLPDEEEEKEDSCARCRVYQRKRSTTDTILSQKLKQIYQIHHEHNYFSTQPTSSSTADSDLLDSLSKLADRIGQPSPTNAPHFSRKLSSQATMKKKPPPKLQSSISMIVGESTKSNKRTSDELKNLSNSNFISTNFDVTSKRQKRIASPQSSLSVSSTGTTPGPASSVSPPEILTPSCRTLNQTDYDLSSSEPAESEDVSDESYIRRHIRCELEQETWLKNAPGTSIRKNSLLQASLSVPNGFSTTTMNSKQHRYHVTSNGIAYTETVDAK